MLNSCSLGKNSRKSSFSPYPQGKYEPPIQNDIKVFILELATFPEANCVHARSRENESPSKQPLKPTNRANPFSWCTSATIGPVPVPQEEVATFKLQSFPGLLPPKAASKVIPAFGIDRCMHNSILLFPWPFPPHVHDSSSVFLEI